LVLTSLILLSQLATPSPIEARFAEIEASTQCRLGAAIITPTARHYHRKNERFSLQSVMKLMVAMAALDQVDQGRWKPGQTFTFRRSDLSVYVQPIAEDLGDKDQITVTLEQCIEYTVTESCSASGDFLIRTMGGVHMVNAFLRRHGIRDLSVNREERDLQTNILGMYWKPEYVDEARFEAAIQARPHAELAAAYRRYQADPRDTTTPEAMGDLLGRLVTYKLLSKRSTDYLMGVMERTKTGAMRLKAGVPAGWRLGHKTGTSSSYGGVTAATNDVGYARRGPNDWVILVALVADSTAPYEARERAVAQVAETAFRRP